MRYVEGEWQGHMYGPGWGDPSFPHATDLGAVRVWRSTAESLTIGFGRRRLPRRLPDRWIISSSFEQPGHDACAPPDGPVDGGYGSCTDFSDFMHFSNEYWHL